MCMSVHLKVKTVAKKNAFMEDGRIVKLGGLQDVAPGDYLEVYADLALGKIEKANVRVTQKARETGGVYVS